MLKHEIQDISENTERSENLTQSWEHKMHFSGAIMMTS